MTGLRGTDQTMDGDEPTSSAAGLLDLDLNLLIALDALLTNRSVTLAAASVHRSQPALSASLKRLRHQFRDELLVRVGNRHELTPLASQLKPRVAMILADLERLFATRTRFDAANSTRTFTLHTTDYGQAMLGRAVADELADHAPNTKLQLLPLSDRFIDNADDALRSADGFVIPAGFLQGGLPRVDVYTDRWVFLVDGDHSDIGADGEPITLDDLRHRQWVAPFHRPTSRIPAIRQLQFLGVDLDVVVSAEGFVPLPSLIVGTDRVTVLQEGLARRVASAGVFRVLDCPFEVSPIAESMWWHPTLELDPGHQWFRQLVARAGGRIAAELAA
ncbi:MAG: LysR family transcriptional regulator [Acidimicrobiales bacterium]